MKKLLLVSALFLILLGCSKDNSFDPHQDYFDGRMELLVVADCRFYYYEASENLYWWDTVLYNPLVCPVCGDPVVILDTICNGIHIK
jgi:hypothetical protein